MRHGPDWSADVCDCDGCQDVALPEVLDRHAPVECPVCGHWVLPERTQEEHEALYGERYTGAFHLVQTGPAHPRGEGHWLLLQEVQDAPTHFDYREVDDLRGATLYFPTEDAARRFAVEELGATAVVVL